MLISCIIDCADIDIRISPENPISLEVHCQHITFPTHIPLNGTKNCLICLLVVAHAFILPPYFSNLHSYSTILSSLTSSLYSFLFLPPLFSSTITLCLSPSATCALLYFVLHSPSLPAAPPCCLLFPCANQATLGIRCIWLPLFQLMAHTCGTDRHTHKDTHNTHTPVFHNTVSESRWSPPGDVID